MDGNSYREINVSPYGTNVLDLVGRADLCTRLGEPIKINHGTFGFVLSIGAETFTTDDNITASYILNNVGCCVRT